MFQDMPEMTPGAHIAKKPLIEIRASQPGFRNRASDRLVVMPPANQMAGPKNPANQQGPQHGKLSATQAADQWIRAWEKNIPLLIHWNPISPTPIHGNYKQYDKWKNTRNWYMYVGTMYTFFKFCGLWYKIT